MDAMIQHLDSGVIAELQAVLGEEFPVLVRTFLLDGEKRLSALRGAAGTGDANALREAAHSLKGASLNLGANRLSGLCLEAETRSRSGTLIGIDALLNDIAAEFGQVNRLLTTMSRG